MHINIFECNIYYCTLYLYIVLCPPAHVFMGLIEFARFVGLCQNVGYI